MVAVLSFRYCIAAERDKDDRHDASPGDCCAQLTRDPLVHTSARATQARAPLVALQEARAEAGSSTAGCLSAPFSQR